MPLRGEAADVVRVVEGVSGRVPMRMELALRFDYGHVVPWVREDDGVLLAIGGPDAVWSRTDARLHQEEGTVRSDFEVGAGDRVSFVLTYAPSHRPRPRMAVAVRALLDTENFWTD